MLNKTVVGIFVKAALVSSVGLAVFAADPPSVSITNGIVNAKLWLPDVQAGYYRSTRFDWSGSIASLESGGHSYFGQWFPTYNPLTHDSITGPVEDFAPLNYADAKPGETFVKIGVGTLKKIDDTPYRFSAPYEILDHGTWSVRTEPNAVEFTHTLTDPQSGYGYLYTKTVRLTPGQPQMTIDHRIRNTGAKAISTNVYNHGFYMLDAQPTGPDVSVTFAFDAKAARSMNGAAEVRDRKLVYLQELQVRPAGAGGRGAGGAAGAAAPGAAPAGPPPPPTGASSLIEGFSSTNAADFDFRVENSRTGAGVRVTADRPMSRLNFWSTRTNVSPEPYIEFGAAPGQETSWRLTFDFYSLKSTTPSASR